MSIGGCDSHRLHRIDLVLIAAVAENGVIGRDNQLPWRLKSDLQHFRARTMGKPVVMGRRTFQSLGRQLKGRTVIVITRDPDFCARGAVVAPNLAAALAVARGDALRRSADAVMVVGGGGVYAETLPFADRIELTLVHASPDGDTFFPAIDPAVWRETERVEHAAGPDDGSDFAFVRLERNPGSPARMMV